MFKVLGDVIVSNSFIFRKKLFPIIPIINFAMMKIILE
jgi:hypothetical protein